MSAPKTRIVISDIRYVRSRKSGLPLVRFCLTLEIVEEVDGREMNFSLSIDGCLAWWNKSGSIVWTTPRAMYGKAVFRQEHVVSPDLYETVRQALAQTESVQAIRENVLGLAEDDDGEVEV